MSYGRTSGWGVFFKILFIIAVYVFGVFSADWWSAKFYSTRVELANKISPDEAKLLTDSTIVGKDAAPLELCVPFTEENGVKYVIMDIDGVKIRALYDTGCGYPVAFSISDYCRLTKAGIVEWNKFTDSSSAITAAGIKVTPFHFNIPKIEIGNITFENQEVVTLTSGTFTLVGNSLWKDYKSYVVDNEKQCITFKK